MKIISNIIYPVEKRVGNYQELFWKDRRDRFEIVSAIIAIAQKPSKSTHIMHEANLSYLILKEYLEFLVRKRLIEKRCMTREGRKAVAVYNATEKGNRFLELHCEQLVLLHGQGFLDNNRMANSYLIQYCRKNKLTSQQRVSRDPSEERIRAIEEDNE